MFVNEVPVPTSGRIRIWGRQNIEFGFGRTATLLRTHDENQALPDLALSLPLSLLVVCVLSVPTVC